MSLKSALRLGLLSMGSLLYGNDESKVIYYHDIHSKNIYTPMSTSMELFAKHMEIVKNMGYIPVKEITDREKEIEITFDDGFLGLYENFTFFAEHRIPVRLFMISGFIGKKGYLNKEQIQEMLNSGLLSLGSHTVSHKNLDTMSDDEAEKELTESKKRLEDLFGIEVEALCYPRGRFCDRTVELAKESGYKKQYSCLPGSYFESFKEGLVNRSLVQHADLKAFEAILNGADTILKNRYIKQQYRN